MDNANNQQPKESIKEWRRFFSLTLQKRALEFVAKGYVQSFSCDEHQASATVISRRNSGFDVQILNAPDSYGTDWNPNSFQCTCGTKTSCAYGVWPNRHYAHTCAHEAAVLLQWENQHGPWQFRETDEEVAARLERERIEEERRRERQRIEEERRKEKRPQGRGHRKA